MKALLTDPVLLICSGIILVGLFGLFWAISKFKKTKSESSKPWSGDAVSLAMPALGELYRPRSPVVPVVVASTPAPVINKDVADRLESMTQRLAEMQTMLLKQSAPGAPDIGAAPGAVGQGFSPETIDKLLKIIGNVIQQVDILQKSLNPPKES